MPLHIPRSRGFRRVPLLGSSAAGAAAIDAARDSAPPEEFSLRHLPWSPGITPTWTAPGIRSALAAHELGTFSESGRLVDAMGRDDRIAPVASVRERGLLSMPFSIVPPDEKDKEAAEFCAALEKMWPRILKTGIAQRLLHQYIFTGFACGQVYWERYDGAWEPRVVDEHPSFMWWQEFEMAYYLTTRDGMSRVTPGDGKWFLMEAGERGFKNGAVRALAILWLIRTFTWRDWARYSERHGMPIVKAKVPAQIREDARRKFWSDIVNLGRETSVLLPQGIGPNGEGFDLDLLEASARSWPAFQKLQEAANAAIAIYLLGQNLTTEAGTSGSSGAYATAKVHENVKAQVIAADEREFGDALYWQVMRPVASMLRPGGELIVGRPTWDTTPDEDRAELATTTLSAAQTLQTLKTAGYRVRDIEVFGEKFGLDLEEAPEPPPTPPGFAPGQPGAPQQPGQAAPGQPAPAAPGAKGGPGKAGPKGKLEDKGDGDGKTGDGSKAGVGSKKSSADDSEKANALTEALLAAVEGASDAEDLQARVALAFKDQARDDRERWGEGKSGDGKGKEHVVTDAQNHPIHVAPSKDAAKKWAKENPGKAGYVHPRAGYEKFNPHKKEAVEAVKKAQPPKF